MNVLPTRADRMRAVLARGASRAELEADSRRLAANRRNAPRAVALERILIIALDNENDLAPGLRMLGPARERLEQLAAEVSDVIRCGGELTEDAHQTVIAFLREHVRDHESLMRRVVEAVGA